MKKFFNTIIALLVFLIAALLAVIFYVSGVNEEKFRSFVQFSNENNEIVNTEIVSYKKGLFSSTAITRSKPKFIQSESSIQVVHTIWNGPIVYTGSKVKPIDLQMARVISIPGEVPKSLELDFTLISTISFENAIDLYLQGSKFSLTLAQYKLQSQSWSSKAHISENWETIKGDSTIPAMSLEFMGMVFQFNDILTKMDLTRTKFGFWLGDTNFSVGQATGELAGVELHNLQSQEKSILKDDLLFIDWKLNLDKFSFAKIGYGPLILGFQFNNLKPEILVELAQAKGKLKNPEDTLKSFLMARPEILIKDSSLMLPQGMSTLDAGIAVGGPNIGTPINANMIEQTMDGHILAVIPQELVREGLSMGLITAIEKDPEYQKLDVEHKKQYFAQQLELKVKKLITDGILFEQDKHYVIKISIEKGKWLANGKEIAQPLS